MTDIEEIARTLQKAKEEPSSGLEALDILRRRRDIIDEMIALEAPVKETREAFEAAKREYERQMELIEPRMTQVDTELNALMEKL